MPTFYNEIDGFAARWLRNLMDAGHIAAGTVDERPIEALAASDIRGERAHFFAGIGGWDYALRLAGWPADRPVWTGSCPCQPFSAAGKRRGTDDPRHLWPAWFRLIAECRPPVVFGEQVASRDGREWLAGVRADLEAVGYEVGAADLCAASVGAPHIRQRLWWVAYAGSERRQQIPRGASGHEGSNGRRADGDHVAPGGRESSRLADSDGRIASDRGLQRGGGYLQQPQDETVGRLEHAARDGRLEGRAESGGREPAERCGAGGVGDADSEGHAERDRFAGDDGAALIQAGRQAALQAGPCGPDGRMDNATSEQVGRAGQPWQDGSWLRCLDGLSRRVEPGVFPLAHGVPSRVGRLRAYGNAIVPQVGAAFVRAVMDVIA